jgi:hypothetical protein
MGLLRIRAEHLRVGDNLIEPLGKRWRSDTRCRRGTGRSGAINVHRAGDASHILTRRPACLLHLWQIDIAGFRHPHIALQHLGDVALLLGAELTGATTGQRPAQIFQPGDETAGIFLAR